MPERKQTLKITIEINEEEIRQEVFSILTRRLADQIFSDRLTMDEVIYRKALKDGVNAMLKEHSQEIINACIPQASSYIGKKAVKKIMDQITTMDQTTTEDSK